MSRKWTMWSAYCPNKCIFTKKHCKIWMFSRLLIDQRSVSHSSWDRKSLLIMITCKIIKEYPRAAKAIFQMHRTRTKSRLAIWTSLRRRKNLIRCKTYLRRRPPSCPVKKHRKCRWHRRRGMCRAIRRPSIRRRRAALISTTSRNCEVSYRRGRRK